MAPSERAFDIVELPSRPTKPRDRGLTMAVDWGLGLNAQRDYLEAAGAYIDLGKIAIGLSGLLSRDYLAEKIQLYHQYQVETFPGGMFLEYAVSKGRADACLEAARDVGYQAIEVSDNLLDISLEDKWRLIERARDAHGFRVLGEVGRKVGTTSAEGLVEDIRGCMEAGAWKVFVEAVELYQDGFQEELVEGLVKAGLLDHLVFELPGTWIEGVHESDRHHLKTWFLHRFGPEVRLANVEMEEVLGLEALRRGVGIDGWAWRTEDREDWI